MTSGIIERDQNATAFNDATALIQRAIDSNVPVETLERLVDLHERMQKRNAETQFNEAMSAFKAACPIIDKPTTADTGKFKYNYATFGYVCQRIQPHCECHGFSYSFDTELQEKSVKVTCKIKHVAGHFETSSFTAPIDASARMNITQQAASAVSYGKRYALLGAFGIATGGDDDAVSLDSRRIEAEEFAKLKVRWFKSIDKKKTKAAHDREAAFVAWASGVVGREFDASSINNWTYTDFVVCDNTIFDVERLKDGESMNVGEAADAILGEEDVSELVEGEAAE